MPIFLPGPGPLEQTHNASAGATGPTTYNQSVSGALSFVGGAPTFAMNRSLTGALSFTGAAPLAAVTRLLAAGFTPTGALSRRPARILAGALTFTGAAILAAIQRSLAAVFTPTGALVKATARKLLAGFTPTGSIAKRWTHTLTAAFAPTGSLTTARLYARVLANASLTFLGGTNLYPDPNLYPGPDIYPYGGAILFQLNRALPAVLQPAASLLTHAAQARLFTAILQPQVLFLKTSARIFLSAEFTTATLLAVRMSHTIAQALFASLQSAGSLSSVQNQGRIYPGGGGFGVPMPDEFFTRYQPTLRRQKVKV